MPAKQQSRTVLLTLGRLPKALELARALKGAGCRVLVADPFRWHLARPSNAVDRSIQTPAPATRQADYLKALLSIIAEEKVDLVIPVSEEALHVTLLASRLPPQTGLFSNPHAILCKLHDKYLFNQMARAAGLPVPDTCLASDPGAARLAASSPSVVKPRTGCSGEKMQMLTPGILPDGLMNDPEAIVQRRIFGREVSTLSLCHQGKILAHVTYEGEVYSGTVAVCFKRVDDAPEVTEWVARFVEAGSHSHFLAFDFIIDDQGTPWPLECNPRLTSGIHFMDPQDLARAICAFGPDETVGLRSGTRFQEGHTTLLQVYASLLRPKTMIQRARSMISSRDVLWSANDPLPFPFMTFSSWPVLRQVLFQGRSFGEAATRDISWSGDDGTVGGKDRTGVNLASASPAARKVNAHGT